MSGIVELDTQFRPLRAECIRNFEDRVKADRAQRELWLQRSDLLASKSKSAMRAAELDRGQTDSLAQQDIAFVKKHLEQVRPQLTQRAVDATEQGRRSAFLNGMQLDRGRLIYPYAATVLAENQEDLRHIEGERGNPWVQPWNPGPVKIKREQWGGGNGWCGWAQPALPTVGVTFWFPFLADTTALWWLYPVIGFHGFYYLFANKDWWNCIDCRATLDVFVNAYQYVWNGSRHVNLLNVDEDSGAKFGSYDESPDISITTPLRNDSQYYVFVKVDVLIYVHPYGPGTYGEMNFMDGTANYIQPLVMFAAPNG